MGVISEFLPFYRGILGLYRVIWGEEGHSGDIGLSGVISEF